MISERYLVRLRVLISCKKVFRVAEEIAVRNRLMKAVFFLSDESRDLPTGKTATQNVNLVLSIVLAPMTFAYLDRRPMRAH